MSVTISAAETLRVHARKARRVDAGRDATVAVLKAVELLPSRERALMRAYYLGRRTSIELAAAAGCSAETMRRKLRAIWRRIGHPCFVLTVEFGRELPEDLGGVARAYFYEGQALGVVARRVGVSPFRARVMLAEARAMLVMAGVDKYGGTEPQGRALIAALLGALPLEEAETRVAGAAARGEPSPDTVR